jgi:hypothetical protein
MRGGTCTAPVRTHDRPRHAAAASTAAAAAAVRPPPLSLSPLPLSLRPQVVEDGYEFFAKRQLVTLFSAPNYCGEFDNAGAMMSVDETLMCSFQILKPADKKQVRRCYNTSTFGGALLSHNSSTLVDTPLCTTI